MPRPRPEGCSSFDSNVRRPPENATISVREAIPDDQMRSLVECDGPVVQPNRSGATLDSQQLSFEAELRAALDAHTASSESQPQLLGETSRDFRMGHLGCDG